MAKNERLKSKKLIEKLFEKGKALNLSPVCMVYLPCDALSSHQVLFAVPSKRIKSAVTRNKVKRRMREAYRLNKHLLATYPGVYFLIGYIYIGPHKPCDFKTIQKKVVASLHYLNNLHEHNNTEVPKA